MHTEITSAVSFIITMLKPAKLSITQSTTFTKTLHSLIEARCLSSWDSENPTKGSAFRAISTFRSQFDSILIEAAGKADVSIDVLQRHLPSDFVIWIDPGEVSYRFGDQGSICVIYSKEKEFKVESKKIKITKPSKKIISTPLKHAATSALKVVC